MTSPALRYYWSLTPVNGGDKTGHVAAQKQASGEMPSAMARALTK